MITVALRKHLTENLILEELDAEEEYYKKLEDRYYNDIDGYDPDEDDDFRRFKDDAPIYLVRKMAINKMFREYEKDYLKAFTHIFGDDEGNRILKDINQGINQGRHVVAFTSPVIEARKVSTTNLDSAELAGHHYDDDDDGFNGDINIDVELNGFYKLNIIDKLESDIKKYEEGEKRSFMVKTELPNIKTFLNKFTPREVYNFQVLFGNKPSIIKQTSLVNLINDLPLDTLKQIIDIRVTNKQG